MDLHRLAEERSLALHREIAARIGRDPELLRLAREEVERWSREGQASSYYVRRWSALLDGPVEELLGKITDDDEDARAMRQTNPFVGVVDQATRSRIWSEVRERFEQAS